MKYSIAALTLLIILGGCDQPTVQNTETKKEVQTAQVVKQNYLPSPPPKKEIKLKDVNDTNFDAAYMYPKESKKKETVAIASQKPIIAEGSMDKAQCIAMITQEKFDKYTAMFGSEEASIKRCRMLKAASL
jgi:hypothetical protein